MMLKIAAGHEDSPQGSGYLVASLPSMTPPDASQVQSVVTSRDGALLMQLLSSCLLLVDAATATTTLLNCYHSYADVVAAPFEELQTIPSVGEHCARLLKCVHAAAIHLAFVPLQQATGINDWASLNAYLNTSMAREKREIFRVLFLNQNNNVISDQIMAEGKINSVRVSIRDIAVKSLQLGATAIILLHNHPSGNPRPSIEDSYMTGEIRDTLASLDICLYDHIIVGKGQFYSFKEMKPIVI